jgi:aminoglycoside phosphotransferase (APT) family kinase protein
VDARAVAALVRPASRAAVRCFRPISGGLVNTNLEVMLDGPPRRVLLRLYQRDPSHARKEAALARRLAGRVPVARFLHFGESNPVTGQPYAVLEWIEGTRLDQQAADASPRTLDALGRAVGAVLAGIHSIRFEQYGFLDAALHVVGPIDFSADGLTAYLRQSLGAGASRELLGAALSDQVLAFAERESHRLATWPHTPTLAHADFNGSNILLRRARGWRVAGVLDWEFALSAMPALDFANLLRPPLGDGAAFVAGLAAGYRAAGGALPEHWHLTARIADLFAWADLLNRHGSDPALVADARRAVRLTIASSLITGTSPSVGAS